MVWTSILSPLVFFVQRVSFCETLDSVSEYRLELILKVCFFSFSPVGGERGWVFQGFSRSENTEEMSPEILFLNAGCQDPPPYFLQIHLCFWLQGVFFVRSYDHQIFFSRAYTSVISFALPPMPKHLTRRTVLYGSCDIFVYHSLHDYEDQCANILSLLSEVCSLCFLLGIYNFHIETEFL